MTGGRSDDEADSKILRARKGIWHHRKHLDGRNRGQFLLHDRVMNFRWRFARAPRLQDHATETKARLSDLKRETCVRNVSKNLFGGLGVADRVVDRRIRRRSHDSEHETLIFFP